MMPQSHQGTKLVDIFISVLYELFSSCLCAFVAKIDFMKRTRL